VQGMRRYLRVPVSPYLRVPASLLSPAHAFDSNCGTFINSPPLRAD